MGWNNTTASYIDDETLVLAFKNGDEESFNFLLDRFSRQIEQLCRSFFAPGLGYNDLFQEGSLGLFQAAKRFDPDKGMSFNSFARLHIKNQLINAVRTALRKKQRILSESYSFDETLRGDHDANRKKIEMIDSLEPSPEEIYLETIELSEKKQKYNEIISKLSPLERQVLNLLLSGLTYKEAACKLGVTPKTIDNAMSRIKRKLYNKETYEQVVELA